KQSPFILPQLNGSTGGQSRRSHAARTACTSNCGERDPKMSNPRITFVQLRKLLLEIGFIETLVPNSHVFFSHQQSGAEIALPIYRANRIVLPHHLASVRIMLDAKGLMEGADFDDFVASVSAKQSAS